MLRSASLGMTRIATLRLTLALHRRGYRTAADAEEVLRAFDLIYRAQFTEGFFNLPQGSISTRIGKGNSAQVLSRLIRQAWQKNSDKLIFDAWKASCRQPSRGEFPPWHDPERMEELAANFHVSCYEAWWDKTKIYFVGGIKSLIRKLTRNFPDLLPSELLTEVIFPSVRETHRGGLPAAYLLGRGRRKNILKCEPPRGIRTRVDAFEDFLLCTMLPSEMAGLTNRLVKERIQAKIVTLLQHRQRLESGIPSHPEGSGGRGRATAEPHSEYIEQYAPVIDQETGQIINLPETVMISDVMDSGDWEQGLAEIFSNPSKNRFFLDTLEEFLSSIGLSAFQEGRFQKVIPTFFKALANGFPWVQAGRETTAAAEVARRTGVELRTVKKIIKKFIKSLAKSLDKNIDIVLTEKERGSFEEGLNFEPSATSRTKELAGALLSSTWMGELKVKLERGRGLQEYFPSGGRQPARTRVPVIEDEQTISPGRSIELSKSEKARLERAMNRRASRKRRLLFAAVEESLMNRASQLLQYMDAGAVAKKLVTEMVREGADLKGAKQDAYLAVKAGTLLNQERMSRLAAKVAARYL